MQNSHFMKQYTAKLSKILNETHFNYMFTVIDTIDCDIVTDDLFILNWIRIIRIVFVVMIVEYYFQWSTCFTDWLQD